MGHRAVAITAGVQERLAHEGYNPGAPDGVAGPETRAAIMERNAVWLVHRRWDFA